MDCEMPVLSWDMGASTSTSMDVDPNLGKLCKLCSKLDFKWLGFHKNLPKDWRVWGWRVRLPPQLRYSSSIGEVIKNAEDQCVICVKVVNVFQQWKRRNFDGSDPHHLDTSKAYYAIDSLSLQSIENDSEIESTGQLVRFKVTLKIYSEKSTEISQTLHIQFQKCSQPPLHHRFWELEEEQPYNGRIREQKVDTKLFWNWIRTCRKNHGKCALVAHTTTPPGKLRLIDVNNRCLIDKVEHCQFVALSYVWGEVKFDAHKKMPKLTRGEENFLKTPGSLTRKKVLATIDDAITLVAQLGYQYLWVDCLCIMQDGELDLELIKAMDSIYGLALFTIVAASGDNADAGLPGVQEDRSKQEVIMIKDGISLVQTLDPMETKMYPDYYKYIEGSTWSTRGWTLQEKIFSRRTLIFTKEQVYWECQIATWCEDSFWEVQESPILYRQCFDIEEFRLPWNNDDKCKFEDRYLRLVEEYSSRKLTNEADGLNAFQGILNALGRGIEVGKQEFLWGLPLSLLANALKWRKSPGLGASHILKRRDIMHPISAGCTCSFPSWSWVGWVGNVEYFYELKDGGLNGWETVGLHIYYLDDQKMLREIPQASLLDKFSASLIRKPIDKMHVSANDGLPKFVDSSILFFWSSAAKFHINFGLQKVTESRKVVGIAFSPINSKSGSIIVKALFQVPSIPREYECEEVVIVESVTVNIEEEGNDDKEDKEVFELVVIGTPSPEFPYFLKQDTRFMWNEYFIVLVCSKKEDILYRKGLVHIPAMEWMKCEPEWKLICLG